MTPKTLPEKKKRHCYTMYQQLLAELANSISILTGTSVISAQIKVTSHVLSDMPLPGASFPTGDQEIPLKLFDSFILPKVTAHPFSLLGVPPSHALLYRVSVFILLHSCSCSEGGHGERAW